MPRLKAENKRRKAPFISERLRKARNIEIYRYLHFYHPPHPESLSATLSILVARNGQRYSPSGEHAPGYVPVQTARLPSI